MDDTPVDVGQSDQDYQHFVAESLRVLCVLSDDVEHPECDHEHDAKTAIRVLREMGWRPNLAEMEAENERLKAPRDVLADRITKWAGEADVYEYADRLLADLDAAGWDVMPNVCHACKGELGAHCAEHGYVMWGAEQGGTVAGPIGGRMQWVEGTLIGDIAMVLTVYDEHVPEANRGPWRDRLAAWVEAEQ